MKGSYVPVWSLRRVDVLKAVMKASINNKYRTFKRGLTDLLLVVLTKIKMNPTTKNVAKYEALRIIGRPLTRCTGKKSKAQRSAAVLRIFIVSPRAHSSRRDTRKG